MMNERGFILSLLAETPIHAGTGQSAGVVDLPVAREGATGLPHVPETSLKGALRQWAEDVYGKHSSEVKQLFGTADSDVDEDGNRIGGAGLLLISTARLLFLPVRRLDAAYAWVTTPFMLERFQRDIDRAVKDVAAPQITDLASDILLVTGESGKSIFLEEYVFKTDKLDKADADSMTNIIEKLVSSELAVRFAKQLGIMDSDEFSWFAANALPVDARNHLNSAKMSDNLWYEETLPPDTLLYSVILPRSGDPRCLELFNDFKGKLENAKFVQVGGNETVGQGWLRVMTLGGD